MGPMFIEANSFILCFWLGQTQFQHTSTFTYNGPANGKQGQHETIKHISNLFASKKSKTLDREKNTNKITQKEKIGDCY